MVWLSMTVSYCGVAWSMTVSVTTSPWKTSDNEQQKTLWTAKFCFDLAEADKGKGGSRATLS